MIRMITGSRVNACLLNSTPSKTRTNTTQLTQDPIIRQVLTDLQENPAAGRQALADPGVAAKIEKLIAAGVLRTG